MLTLHSNLFNYKDSVTAELSVVLLPEVLLPDLLQHVLVDLVREVQGLPFRFEGTLETESELKTESEEQTLTARPKPPT